LGKELLIASQARPTHVLSLPQEACPAKHFVLNLDNRWLQNNPEEERRPEPALQHFFLY
jgi:hypothetical protein